MQEPRTGVIGDETDGGISGFLSSRDRISADGIDKVVPRSARTSDHRERVLKALQ